MLAALLALRAREKLMNFTAPENGITCETEPAVKTLQLGPLTLPSRYFLSPLAGYTNMPFRVAVRELGGVGLVTVGGGGGGATMAGDGLVLASLLLSATVTVAQGRLLAGRDPLAVTAVQFLGATLGALPVAVLTEGMPAMPHGAGPVLVVAALAAAGTLLPFTLFAFGQSRVSAEVAGAFLNLEPLVGALAGAVAFGDPVGLVQVAGGLAILGGIGLSSLPLIAGRRAEAQRVAATPVAPMVSMAPVVSVAPMVSMAPVATPAVTCQAQARTEECGSLMDRSTRDPHPSTSRPDPGERNVAFVVIRGGKFGAGAASSVEVRGRAGHHGWWSKQAA